MQLFNRLKIVTFVTTSKVVTYSLLYGLRSVATGSPLLLRKVLYALHAPVCQYPREPVTILNKKHTHSVQFVTIVTEH